MCLEQRGVLHDQRIGIEDRFAQTDFLVVDTAERNHRRAHALGAETRKGLGMLALKVGGNRQKFRGRDDTLPPAAVDAHLEHGERSSLYAAILQAAGIGGPAKFVGYW